MIALASLVGFALVFLVVSVAVSLLVGPLALRRVPRLRSLGCAVERKAMSWSLVLPPVVGLSITLALIGHSLLDQAPSGDHCSSDLRHLHLCLFHGAAWLENTGAVAVVAGLGSVAFVRSAMRLARLGGARRALARLVAVGTVSPEPDVVVVPSTKHFCFSGGILQPRIFFSRASWQALDPVERQAVIEHERAHVRQGDIWRRAVLGLLALFGAPYVGRALLRRWEHATERLCDRRAAAAVGDPTIVARALVSLAAAVPEPVVPVAPALAFVTGCDVVDRVEALLAGHPDGAEAAGRLGAQALTLTVVCVALAVGAADPLHHGLETLLGSL